MTLPEEIKNMVKKDMTFEVFLDRCALESEKTETEYKKAIKDGLKGNISKLKKYFKTK